MFKLFKKIEPPQILVLKDYPKKLVKKVITIEDGDKQIDFYEFVTLYDMPGKRYAAFNDFLEDYHRRISNKDLLLNLDEAIREVNSNDVDQITNLAIRLKWLKARAEVANDVDLIMRILSCVLFVEDENLLQYDYDIADWKIKLFEKYGVSAFFLHEPVRKYWQSTNISRKDIQTILEQRRKKVKSIRELNKMGIYTVMDYLGNKKEIDST